MDDPAGSGKSGRVRRNPWRGQLAPVSTRRVNIILASVTTAAENLMQASHWEDCIEEILGALGDAAGVSRAYLYAYRCDEGREVCELLHEWVDGSVEPQSNQPRLRRIPINSSAFDHISGLLSAGEAVTRYENHYTPEESALFSLKSARSMLLAPIQVGGRWWGFIGFDECHWQHYWQATTIRTLKMAAGLIGAAIQRRQSDTTIRNLLLSERKQRQIAQALRNAGLRLSTSLEPDKILDLLMEQVRRVVPFDSATVLGIEGEEAIILRASGFNLKPGQHVVGIRFKMDQVGNLQSIRDTLQPHFIPDTHQSSSWVVTEVGAHIQSWVGAPIIAQDRLLGFLSLDKNEVNFYNAEHAEQLMSFAGQAGMALQNAYSYAEINELLEREQQLNELSRTVSSVLDLDSAIQKTLELTTTIMHADASALALLTPEQIEQGEMTFSHLHGMPAHLQQLPIKRGESPLWSAVENHQSILYCIYHQDQHPEAQQWFQQGMRCLALSPLMVGEQCLGVLAAFNLEQLRCFSEREVALLDTISRQTGIAIQNVRLYQELKHRAQESEMLWRASSAVASALDLPIVLDKILVHLAEVVPYTSAAVFLQEGERLHLVAGRGFPAEAGLIGEYYPADDELFLLARNRGEAMVVDDVSKDPRFHGWGGVSHVRGWMIIPLIANGQVIGIITVDSDQPGAFRPSSTRLGQAFANEAATAIEKARLFNQVQQLAITDPLTGVNNRRYFFEAGRQEFLRAQRAQSPLSLIMMDIDHFKLFNDRYGHMAGDRILNAIAHLCKSMIRQEDILARYGGEEFLILLPDTPIEKAQHAALRIREALQRLTIQLDEQEVGVSISFGLACAFDPGELSQCRDLSELFQHADEALYLTKTTGRGMINTWKNVIETNPGGGET